MQAGVNFEKSAPSLSHQLEYDTLSPVTNRADVQNVADDFSWVLELDFSVLEEQLGKLI